MKHIELPLGNPPIKGYLHHAYPLSIMSAFESYLPWFHSNYIQLFCSKDFNDLYCPVNFHFYQDFNNYPLLEINTFQRTIVDSLANVKIIEFIKDNINNGFHVLSFVNEFYIRDTPSWLKEHYTHDLLISGYSNVHGHLIVSSYFNQQFGKRTILFEDYEKAYHHTDFSIGGYTKDIRLIKFNTNEHYEYELNCELIINFLDDYISRRNSFRTLFFSDENRLAFGLDVYQYLVNHFHLLLLGEAELDIRPLHIVWEHKKCMVSRIEYLLKMDVLKKETHYYDYIKLEKISNDIRFTLIKYELKKDPKFIEHIITHLKFLQNEEELLMFRILDDLVKNRNNFPERTWIIK